MQAFVAAEKFIDVAGTRVRYLEAGTGPPLLLVHGLGQSSTAWRRALPGFSERRRVIAPDLPGFGGSDAPLDAPYDPAYYADVLDAFARGLSLDGFDAAGHSAGGLTILIDALRAPARYRRIVLVDPAGFTPTPDNLLGTAAVSLTRLLVSMPRTRAMTKALYATAFFDPRNVDEETVDELVKRGANPPAKAAARRAFAKYFDYCRRLGPFHDGLRVLAVPVLAIWGSDDRLFRPNDAAVVNHVLPNSVTDVFERCGHCPQLEAPDRFVARVSEFLCAP